MTDWATISSLATGAGTLVLAVATFASVRSANRSARVAELALEEQRRPVLVPSRMNDPDQKIMFVDGHWIHVSGSGAVAEHVDNVVYLAIGLRNVGAGIGVLQSWAIHPGRESTRTDHAVDGEFRALSRDLYIPAGDIGLWQGALRDPSDRMHGEIAAAVRRREPITIELLYTDQVGGQRTISRFVLTPVAEDRWLTSVNRHWYLDGSGPR
ncbi:MAG: hypothetical protein JO168_04340 [Solirubrobacterales bacterium]|nr:hypothetical protein [Solirubrobacterales bacterium]MBV9715311.1 hypothetical protein [Solirubrobacterales bacterium]